MKNLVQFFILALIVTACNTESDTTPLELQNTIFVENPEGEYDGKRSYGPLINLQVEYGRLECERQFTDCRCEDTHLNTFCRWKVNILSVPPLEFEEPPMVPNFCHIIPCGWDYEDPWKFSENTDPLKFTSIKDYYDLQINQPTAEGFMFSVNQKLLGVQFYKLNPMMGDPNPQPSIYYLNNKIVFDKKLAEEIGLKGYTIEEGKYPVIYNKKNETYNVIFEVK